jgi:hypothetical protein
LQESRSLPGSRPVAFARSHPKPVRGQHHLPGQFDVGPVRGGGRVLQSARLDDSIVNLNGGSHGTNHWGRPHRHFPTLERAEGQRAAESADRAMPRENLIGRKV